MELVPFFHFNQRSVLGSLSISLSVARYGSPTHPAAVFTATRAVRAMCWLTLALRDPKWSALNWLLDEHDTPSCSISQRSLPSKIPSVSLTPCGWGHRLNNPSIGLRGGGSLVGLGDPSREAKEFHQRTPFVGGRPSQKQTTFKGCPMEVLKVV